MTSSVYDKGPDKYGFGRYSIVCHAPAPVADALQRFRAAIGMSHVTTEPHVSMVSHLSGLVDLDALTSRLQKLANAADPIRIEFLERSLRYGTSDAVLAVAATPELTALRTAVCGALSGLVASPPSNGSDWSAHLTVYQGGNTETAQRAQALAHTLDVGTGFDAATIDLVGRLGTPPGGLRKIIASIPLQRRG